MAHQFILNVLMLLGRYSTEFDILQHESLHDYFEYARIIGNKYYMILKGYSNNVFVKFVKEKLTFTQIQDE